MHKDKTILLIEDDQVDALAVKKVFKETEIMNDLVHRANAIEALDYLNGPPSPDVGLILLDLNMPMMNGIEFLEKRRQSQHLAAIPLIVLTTSRNESDVKNSYALGISGYVVKPVNYNDFKNVIKSVYSFWSICELPE